MGRLSPIDVLVIDDRVLAQLSEPDRRDAFNSGLVCDVLKIF
jgi:hypothetical protein